MIIYYFIILVLFYVPTLEIGTPVASLGAFIWILVFSMCFDWWDDYKRHRQDEEMNNHKVKVIRDG